MKTIKMSNCFIIGLICLTLLTRMSIANASNHWQWNGLWSKKQQNFWSVIGHNYQLNREAHNPMVTREMRWFLRQHEYLYELTRNSKLYIYYIYNQTQKRGMPAELALLPMIESNYKPFAYSSTGAVGLWQMMPGTASGFGLKINWWYDGRRDLVASTNAALNYLQYLHDYFGNWLLAIAAYNSGEGRVIRAIRYNKRRGRPTDFWSLPLPQQTKLYVPKLLALAQILKKSDHYGAKIVNFNSQPYFTSIKLSKPINLVHVAELAKINVDTIRHLNAGFRNWASAPDRKYNLLIPVTAVDELRAQLVKEMVNKHYAVNGKYFNYTVQSGDSLGELANKYHTSVSAIKEINDLASPTIRIDQSLKIPNSSYTALAKNNTITNDKKIPGPQRIDYIVKHNDSINKIARRYGVSASKIYYWNNMTRHSILQPQQHLVIWKKPRITYYRVRPADSLDKIAKRFNTSTSHLKRLNNLNNSLIRIGQRLKIPLAA